IPGRGRRQAANSRGVRPFLEALEDRTVPSTLAVTNSGDDVTVKGTLRYAVAHAGSGDTIQLTGAVKDPIVLTQGEPLLYKDLTIRAVGNHPATVSGGGTSRVFEVAAGVSVSLSGLTVKDGVAPDTNSRGGGIFNAGTLAVKDCTISDNFAPPTDMGFSPGF